MVERERREVMKAKETGGPAFPLGNTPEEWMNGMDLRDYFAAKAMQSLISKYGFISDEINFAAEQSYVIADAMIAARAK